MLSTWVRRFTDRNAKANQIADTWASIITCGFSSGSFSCPNYLTAYKNVFGIKPQGGRLVDFNDFYHASLIADRLDDKTEAMVFDYLLNHKNGIYYIYDRPIGSEYINVLPDKFASKLASRYIGAIELLSKYRNNLYKLNFAAEWIENNRKDNGKWDMGSAVNDKIYFPLSDSWQRKNVRETDCTYRIQNLLSIISSVERT